MNRSLAARRGASIPCRVDGEGQQNGHDDRDTIKEDSGGSLNSQTVSFLPDPAP
jgi:hypothetical protein